jgi:hypothetical protein
MAAERIDRGCNSRVRIDQPFDVVFRQDAHVRRV